VIIAQSCAQFAQNCASFFTAKVIAA